MALPRYHDDPVPRNAARRVWNVVYGAVRDNPGATVQLIAQIIRNVLIHEDDDGWFPRLGTVLALPTVSTIAMVRRALKVGSSTMPRGFEKTFAREEVNQNITTDKLEFDDESQFLPKMRTDQRGSLKQILQNGVTPFTNLPSSNINLGKAVVPYKRGPLYGVVGQQGNLSLPFAYRFHSDESNKRASALLLFRHNKEGRNFSDRQYTSIEEKTYTLLWTDYWEFEVTSSSSDFTQTIDGSLQSVTISASDLTGSSVYTIPTAVGTYKYSNGKDHTGATVSSRVWTFTFPKGWTFYGTNLSPWPFTFSRHNFGYGNGVNVFPRQYQYDNSGNTLEDLTDAGHYKDLLDADGKGHLSSPFEEIEPGTPQIFYSGLNRSDLEDISLQLNPMLLTRSGDTVSSTEPSDGKAELKVDQGILSIPWTGTKGFTNIRFGHVFFDGKHSHANESLLAKLNKLDDTRAVQPGGNQGAQSTTQYRGPLGSSFKYNAVLKRGGCRFTCVNRGGSGCNVDVHVFKLKKKHVGTQITWDNLVKPFTDAYLKRYYEIITADDFKGRQPKPEDIWSNPKFPLLPGSRHINAEDQFLNRVATHSYYIPSQGRKSVNLLFPGDRYDPANYVKVVDGASTYPEQDEFTYFCLFSTTGEKSNAMFSTNGSIGTSLISLADFFTVSTQAVVNPPQPPASGGVALPVNPSLPAVPTVTPTAIPSGNTDYDKWVYEHQQWGYSVKEYMFYMQDFINYHSKDVTGWTASTEGPFPDGNQNVYSGYRYSRRIRLPLPSLEQWLDLNYDTAYIEQGVTWKPPKPKVHRIRHWSGFDYYPDTQTFQDYFFGAALSNPIRITAATWVVLDWLEWPVYESEPSGDPVLPPADVTPEFDDVDVEIMSVRTNLFLSSFTCN